MRSLRVGAAEGVVGVRRIDTMNKQGLCEEYAWGPQIRPTTWKLIPPSSNECGLVAGEDDKYSKCSEESRAGDRQEMFVVRECNYLWGSLQKRISLFQTPRILMNNAVVWDTVVR
jgi:hypothetical protein